MTKLKHALILSVTLLCCISGRADDTPESQKDQAEKFSQKVKGVPASEIHIVVFVMAPLTAAAITDKELLFCLTGFKNPPFDRLPLDKIISVEVVDEAIGIRQSGLKMKKPGVRLIFKDEVKIGSYWKRFQAGPHVLAFATNSVITLENGVAREVDHDADSNKARHVAEFLKRLLDAQLAHLPAPASP